MTRIAILPVPTENGIAYCAVAGDKRSRGATAGAALDALTAQLPQNGTDILVIVQNCGPDVFFDQAQQERLAQLMVAWRSAQETGTEWSEGEQAELKTLVEAELRASAARAAALADELHR